MQYLLKITLLFLLAVPYVVRADEPAPALSAWAGDARLQDRAMFVFPELREKPILWYAPVGEAKIDEVFAEKAFVLQARPDEFYVYQLGVCALQSPLEDVRLVFSDLKSPEGQAISAEKNTCFNLGGIDCYGKPFTKRVDVAAGYVQAMWVGVDLTGVPAGVYSGSVTVEAGDEKQTISLSLEVSGEPVANHGYDDGKHLSRLNWLNSTLGVDDEVTKEFVPLRLDGDTVSILGRQFVIAPSGLPMSIASFFEPSNQFLLEKSAPIVAKPFRFIIETEDGEVIRLESGKREIREQTPSKVVWSVRNVADACELECVGRMEFDGFVDYQLFLTARKPLKVRDIRLEVPVVSPMAEYVMGLNLEGGLRPAEHDWKWTTEKNQDMLWLGAVNGGLRIKWKGENYKRPLINVYYKFGKLLMPPSWANGELGGVRFAENAGHVVVTAYSGQREMNAGDTLRYDFELLVTPLKMMNRQNKFRDRYYHGGGPNTAPKVERAKNLGANVLNIHHAEDIYPFINYPHLDENVAELRQLADAAHAENIRLKLYYTTRELTKNLPEFWALNSLNGEVLYPGPGNESRTEALHPGGPHPWLKENVREKYIPAWSNGIRLGKFAGELDLSVITTPDSRLNNFYIAGLDWMLKHLAIDGMYIDDSALNRDTLRRARKLLDAARDDGRIDLHSCNHYHHWFGYVSCLNLYMELLPYADLVWIGEGRNYNRQPDHWLIEVSGIPYGLPSQMLEHGGHPWRGMVYGITSRAGWTGNSPHHLWKFFDEYRMADRVMVGYWDPANPIHSTNDALRLSVYKSENSDAAADDLVIAIGNWSGNDEKAMLEIDWQKLGWTPENTVAYLPGIPEFQEAAESVSLDDFTVPAGRGALLILKKKN